MKVLRHGTNYEQGIIITCSSCGCGYEIESRNDWTGFYRECLSHPKQKIYEYQSTCPECGCREYLGYDRDYYYNPRPMFDRSDFKERYDMKYDSTVD